jgi:hypothetical protein
MSAPKISHISVATYIGILDEIISWSQGRGLPGDANRLRSRLDALSKRDWEDREAERASTRAPDWAYGLEQRLVVDELLASLLPELVDDLVKELRSRRVRSDADPGVWAALDRRSFAEHTNARRKREALAEADVLMSLQRHAERPSYLRIWEGIRALEGLHQARMVPAPFFDVDTLVAEGKHLAEVLCDLLPRTANRLLSLRVQDRFRSELEGTPVDRLEPAASFWHHRIPDLGTWYPVWHRLLYVGPDPFGVWFVPSVQAMYERWWASAERRGGKGGEEPAGRGVEAARPGEEPEERGLEVKTAQARLVERGRAEEAEREEHRRRHAIDERERRHATEDRERQQTADAEARWREEQRRAAEQKERFEQMERNRRGREEELRRRRKDHRPRIPRVQSAANRKQVLRYLKRHGITPVDLTPRVRDVFRREFRVPR